MLRRVKLQCARLLGPALALGKVALLAGMVSACSTVPDAVNPIEWYKGASDLITGSERPEIATPAGSKQDFPDVNKVPERSAENRKALPQGLMADRAAGGYAAPVSRQVTPTKPLARRTPAPADTQVAAAPTGVVPPKPAVQSAALPEQVAQAAPGNGPVQPRLTPGQPQPGARGELGPDAPPPSVDMNPPPPANVPETVPMPGQRKVKPLQAQYERRLAESAQASVYPGMVEMPQAPGRFATAADAEAPIHLVPPSAGRRGSTAFGGGRGLAVPPPPPAPAASFQVAHVDFADTSAKLSASDRSAIAEVARLYRQTGGVIRVIGAASAPVFQMAGHQYQALNAADTSMERANAVARELNRKGVPAGKILVAADSGMSATGTPGAQVFLDVM